MSDCFGGKAMSAMNSGDWQVRAQEMRACAMALEVTDPARVVLLRQADRLVFGAMMSDALGRPPATSSHTLPINKL